MTSGIPGKIPEIFELLLTKMLVKPTAYSITQYFHISSGFLLSVMQPLPDINLSLHDKEEFYFKIMIEVYISTFKIYIKYSMHTMFST